MINVKIHYMVFVAVVITFVTTTAWAEGTTSDSIDTAINAADEDSALEYYERNLKGRKDGIYECGNDLLLICSTKFDTQSADSRNSALRKTKEGAILKVKDWCKAYSVEPKIMPANDKQHILWTYLEKMRPGWMYPEWHFTGLARVVVRDEDYEKETFTTVVAISKKTAEREAKKFIPHVSNDDVLRCVSMYFSHNDFGKFSCIEKNISAMDCEKSEERILAYLEKSPLAEQLRREMMRKPNVIVVTNDVCTFVSTRVSIPRMQQMFLSGGTLLQPLSERTSFGLQAEKMAYVREEQLRKKLDMLKESLRENPSDYILWNLYGRMLLEGNDQIGALIAFRNALIIKPDYAYSLVNCAKIYGSLGLPKLEIAFAIKARGVAKDSWSIKESEKVLFGEGK